MQGPLYRVGRASAGRRSPCSGLCDSPRDCRWLDSGRVRPGSCVWPMCRGCMGQSEGLPPVALYLRRLGRRRTRLLADLRNWSGAPLSGNPSWLEPAALELAGGTRDRVWASASIGFAYSRRAWPTPRGNWLGSAARRSSARCSPLFRSRFPSGRASEDILVGTPVANRTKQAVRETMGYCAGIVPLRGQVDADRSVL